MRLHADRYELVFTKIYYYYCVDIKESRTLSKKRGGFRKAKRVGKKFKLF